MKRRTYSCFFIIAAVASLSACGGSSSGGSSGSGGGSTSDIAGLWDLPGDTVLGFSIVEISPNGAFTNWSEDTVDNCYNSFGATLVNEGNDNYGYIPTGLSDQVVISYKLVNEGDSLRYTSSFLGIDESWQALEGVSSSDFNRCT